MSENFGQSPGQSHRMNPSESGSSELNSAELHSRPGILFYLFAVALVLAILFQGTPISQATPLDRRYRDVFLVVTGLLGLIGGLTWGPVRKVRPESRRFEDSVLTLAAVALPAYALLQWIPLPTAFVALISPARGELLRSLEPLFGKRAFASLSISPAVTFWHFLLVCAYCVMFFAAREFAVRSRRRIWIVAAPVFVAAGIESAMGLVQFFSGSETPLQGTFAIRNHLAGFLEMALPLAATFAIASVTKGRDGEDGGTNPLRMIGSPVLAAAILAVALLTLSRGGFVGILASMLVIAGFALGRSSVPLWRRFLTVTLAGAAIVGVLFVATPLSLVARLSEHTSEGRVALWGEGINVVREFPIVGAGLGGFGSAFLKFKATEGQFVVDYAHNDYLQGLSELGILGFLIVGAFVAAALIRAARLSKRAAKRRGSDQTPAFSETRWVALGCLGALTAILIHSAVDFNLYVPANAVTLAWICGMISGLTPSHRSRRSTVEVAAGLRAGRGRE